MCNQSKHEHYCSCGKDGESHSGHCCCHGETEHESQSFQTTEEEITHLESCLGELREQAKAIEERLSSLRK
jgi:hypothetical protein